jgi:hypothetical protein
MMDLVVNADGSVKTIYSEAIDLFALGQPDIRRGSHVEPNDEGTWEVDLSPVGGPTLGPFLVRSQAIQAEVAWLEQHWLSRRPNAVS